MIIWKHVVLEISKITVTTVFIGVGDVLVDSTNSFMMICIGFSFLFAGITLLRT